MNKPRRRRSRLWLLLAILPTSLGNPHSKPYIPFRTDPYDQPSCKSNPETFWKSDDHKNRRRNNKPAVLDPETTATNPSCPLRFSLGVSKRSHSEAGVGLATSSSSAQGIQQPPVIYPILPWEGPGKQVVFATQYEHLDLLTPTKGDSTHNPNFISEGLIQHLEFPLLFESSAFQTSPILADVNNDGILDAILTDYHGGLYAIGLNVGNPNEHQHTNHRYFLKAQVPRLYVRRQWVESFVNETLGIDPYEAEKLAEAEEERLREEEKQRKIANGEPIDESEQERFRAHDERPHDPYHTYFEYSYLASNKDHEPILRGVTANLLAQDQEDVQGLEERRNRRYPLKQDEETVIYDSLELEQKNQQIIYDSAEGEERNQKIIYDSAEEEEKNQKIIYDSAEQDESSNHRRLQELDEENELANPSMGDDFAQWGDYADDIGRPDDDVTYEEYDNTVEELQRAKEEEGVLVDGDVGAGDAGDDITLAGGDDIYPRYDDYRTDDYPMYNSYDDYYSGKYSDLHDTYFDDKHYIRLPPHILCTPVLAELPKPYTTTGETEQLLFLAVSYYFDEDEYEGFFSYERFDETDKGDETETKRGMYTASAIVVFHFGKSPRWGRQEHLDLSADHSAPVNLTMVGKIPLKEDNSKLGGFALSSPTVADLDGDGKSEVLMGTSMGFLYVMDTQNLIVRDGWPLQLQCGIESKVVVEDVLGDNNLEIFVADVGGNVMCLDHTGKKIWHRNLPYSLTGNEQSEVLGSSPMIFGDVNGDGILDIVLLLQIQTPNQGSKFYLTAFSADTGNDLEGGAFPIQIQTRTTSFDKVKVGEDFVHTKLPPPLLVDMHEDQDHLADYIQRSGTKWTRPNSKTDSSKVPHGGTASGLHIVQPIDTYLVIVEGGSGCSQSIEIGETIGSMVQADDIHGTNKLDLVISTASGNVVTLETLESEAPFHPLNVWNNGELQSRTNGPIHGYSASQGIFVHPVSRQYRDIFGVYVPVTFEIFDNRPSRSTADHPYQVRIKTGTSKLVFSKDFDAPGVYTERLYIPFGPGYYQMNILLKTTHGLIYEDAFHIGYNVHYMDGFSLLLWLPLTIATIAVFLMGANKTQSWEDEDFESGDGKGILGSGLPE